MKYNLNFSLSFASFLSFTRYINCPNEWIILTPKRYATKDPPKRYKNYFAIKRWQIQSIYLHENWKTIEKPLWQSSYLEEYLFEVYFLSISIIICQKSQTTAYTLKTSSIAKIRTVECTNIEKVKCHFVGSIGEATAVAIRRSDVKNSRWESNGFLERRSRTVHPRSWYRQFIWLKTSFRRVSFRPEGFIPLSCQSA